MATGDIETYVLSHDEVQQFYDVIDYALIAALNEGFYLENLNLVNDDKRAVVLSFNRFWEPFIGMHIGYNEEDERCTIPTWDNLISHARAKFMKENRPIPGGRIFITRNCIYYKDENTNEQILFYVIWLGRNDLECDPHKFVKNLRKKRIVDNKSILEMIFG